MHVAMAPLPMPAVVSLARPVRRPRSGGGAGSAGRGSCAAVLAGVAAAMRLWMSRKAAGHSLAFPDASRTSTTTPTCRGSACSVPRACSRYVAAPRGALHASRRRSVAVASTASAKVMSRPHSSSTPQRHAQLPVPSLSPST